MANTAFACVASLALHALALGGLAWLYRSSADAEVARLDVRIASVYLAAAAPAADPLRPPAAIEAPPMPAPPASRPALAPAVRPEVAKAALPARVDPLPLPALPGVADAPSAPASDTPGPADASSSSPAPAFAVEWRVQDWLAQHRHYPRAARRSGAEGTVWVRFVLDRAGALQGSEILESSGHAVLDRAALELLERAAPFPALPRDLAMDEIELVLPIEYDLTLAARG